MSMKNIEIIGFCKHKTAGWDGVFYYGPSEKVRGGTAIFVASRNLHWPMTKERAAKVEPVAAADFPLDSFISDLEKISDNPLPCHAFAFGLLKALKDFKGTSEAQSNQKFITDGDDAFRVVNECWPPYSIWNIGKNMIDGYLPLCRLAAVQPFPGVQRIDPDSLLAIRIDGAQTILKAVGRGPETVKEMESFIARHKDTAKPGSSAYTQIQRYEAAIPLMKQVKGL